MTLILVAVIVCLVALVFAPSRTRAPSSRHEILEGRLRISNSEPSGFFDPDLGRVAETSNAGCKSRADACHYAALSPSQLQRPELKTLAEVAEHYGEALKGLGWIVKLDRDKFIETLGCFRPKKRGGGRLKHPTVKLSHTTRTIDAVVQPWSVLGPDERGRTWDSLESALPVFLKEAGCKSDA